MVTKVDTTVIAEKLREGVRAACAAGSPKLVGFLANADPAARKYAEWTGRACTKDGISYELREVAPVNLEAAIDEANADATVHGILIYYPVFGAAPSFYGGSMDDQLRDRISITKDVEGLCHTYRHALYHNIRSFEATKKKAVVPCTPLAVLKILEFLRAYPLSGKTCTVVNRSEVVGRPLAAMMANDGATVYSVDVDSIYKMEDQKMTTTDVSPLDAVRASDVVVLGVPSKSYKLDANDLKDGAVVINVSTFKNIDDSNCSKQFTYVPLVGRVTVACLERSLLTLYNQYHAPPPPQKKTPSLALAGILFALGIVALRRAALSAS